MVVRNRGATVWVSEKGKVGKGGCGEKMERKRREGGWHEGKLGNEVKGKEGGHGKKMADRYARKLRGTCGEGMHGR